ncbi:hypothetical protein KSC_074780 [Ktedonobacter sp. SOSP1-52]|uniref:ATP-binding protein n=1 Tax=Ktedonobacter sp. SOSP1-52 TaxID=2778366 RepID=UPI0019151290|nr:ATP-binding protein [Ktedonobacter sp. SOSP1-52]GHO68586.1 hypothetical protein KSC_074780 [Ktedonobacter sp. SOSP1-52]
MESLNRIFSRTQSRRQPNININTDEQQHRRPGTPMGAAQPRPAAYPRHPQPEARMRPDNRRAELPPANQAQAPQMPSIPTTRFLSGGQGDPQTAAFTDYPYTESGQTYEGEAYELPARPRPRGSGVQPPLNSTTATHYPAQPRRTQGQAPRAPMPSRPGYPPYHHDDYAHALPADVVEEWSNEEGHEDGPGIMYGDWEGDSDESYNNNYYNNPNHNPVAYDAQHTDVETLQTSPFHAPYQPNYAPRPGQPPAARYNTPTPPRTGHTTRDMSMPMPSHPGQQIQPHLPSTRAPQPQLPVAAQPPVAQPQYHARVTQPLDPRHLEELRRERLETEAFREAITRDIARRPRLPEPVESRALQPARARCPHCKGAGYLRANVNFGHPNFGKPIPCTCKVAEVKEKRRTQLREMSNLDAYQDFNFDTFNPQRPGVYEAYRAAWEFAHDPQGWLLLIGPNGCGKTHLGLSIAHQRLEAGDVVLFSVVPDLLDHLRAAFAPNATEVYDQLFSKMREAGVLILDDLGAQQSSQWAKEKLFQLLNYRYNMSMPTVITANPKGLQDIDERIRSRLGDISLVRRVNMNQSQDYRPIHPGRNE